MSGEDGPDDRAIAADPEKAAVVRSMADEIRGDSSESKQLAATLYRVSDLYDPEEDTSPQEIYLNVRNVMRVKANGGLRRDDG